MRQKLFTSFLFAGLMIPAIASANDPSIFLNGVDITGTKNQQFQNVTVSFDSAGNILITAPQYKIVEQTEHDLPAAAPLPPTAPVRGAAPSKLPTLPVTQNPIYVVGLYNFPGLLGYNVEVSVNGKIVKTFKQDKEIQTHDITQFLLRGSKNTIQYRMIMAADSGISDAAAVDLSLAVATKSVGKTIELTDEYIPLHIKGSDGPKTYTIDFMVP